MGIKISSQFDLNTQIALDSRTWATSLTVRDAIPSYQRYEGLMCFVQEEGKTYQLVGGITNEFWQEFEGQGTEADDIVTEMIEVMVVSNNKYMTQTVAFVVVDDDGDIVTEGQ